VEREAEQALLAAAEHALADVDQHAPGSVAVHQDDAAGLLDYPQVVRAGRLDQAERLVEAGGDLAELEEVVALRLAGHGAVALRGGRGVVVAAAAREREGRDRQRGPGPHRTGTPAGASRYGCSSGPCSSW
jgi:hypothetical protein